jgi:hypothetical protein
MRWGVSFTQRYNSLGISDVDSNTIAECHIRHMTR